MMYVRDAIKKSILWISQNLVQSGNLGLLLLWHVLHFIISIWCFAIGIARILESYFISSGLLKKYKTLDSSKLKYLAIVLDSDGAHRTSEVIELLEWLAAIGVKEICLYDAEGILKKSKELIIKGFNAKLFEEATKTDPFLDEKNMALEFASISDGKEAVVKAANFLFKKYCTSGDSKRLNYTESHMDEALKAIDCWGPDPDLLLVYGPARCHLGFPAWRIRYTEIVHMGPLKSKKYGSLVKAIHKFTTVRQNYGK